MAWTQTLLGNANSYWLRASHQPACFTTNRVLQSLPYQRRGDTLSGLVLSSRSYRLQDRQTAHHSRAQCNDGKGSAAQRDILCRDPQVPKLIKAMISKPRRKFYASRFLLKDHVVGRRVSSGWKTYPIRPLRSIFYANRWIENRAFSNSCLFRRYLLRSEPPFLQRWQQCAPVVLVDEYEPGHCAYAWQAVAPVVQRGNRECEDSVARY